MWCSGVFIRCICPRCVASIRFMKKSFFWCCHVRPVRQRSTRSELTTVTRNQRFQCNFTAPCPAPSSEIIIAWREASSCSSCSASVLIGDKKSSLCEHGIPYHKLHRSHRPPPHPTTSCRNSPASTIRAIPPPSIRFDSSWSTRAKVAVVVMDGAVK